MGHGPTGGVYLSTMPVSRRLAASAGKPDWHIRFPPLRWAASGKGKEASGGRDIRVSLCTDILPGQRSRGHPYNVRSSYTPGREKQRAGRLGRGPYYNAHARFPQEKWPYNGGSAGSLQPSGFRENTTNLLTFVAR